MAGSKRASSGRSKARGQKAPSRTSAKERAQEKLAQRMKKLQGQRKQLEEKRESFKLPFLERGDARSERNYAKAIETREKMAEQLEKISAEIRAIECGAVEALDDVLSDLDHCMRLDDSLRALWFEARNYWRRDDEHGCTAFKFMLPEQFWMVPPGLGAVKPHFSLIHIAVLTQDLTLLERLVEGVKDATELLTQRTSCLERNTPLHLAAAMSEEASYSKTVDFLVSRLATQEVALQNVNGDTALMIAATRSYKCSRLLCSKMKKEQLELTNKEGYTALALAALAGNVEVAEVLANKGASAIVPGLGIGQEGGNGQTLLHLITRAAARGEVPFEAFQKLFRLLKQCGVDPLEASAEFSQTLLHIAAWEQNVDPICKFLLEQGQDPVCQDTFGKTAGDYVSRMDKGILREIYDFYACESPLCVG